MNGSSKLWLLVHLLFPLAPFIIGGILRWLIDSFSISTFSASDLAMSLGLLSLFVQQSLANSNQALDIGSSLEDKQAAATIFLLSAILFFVLFGSIAAMDALIANNNFTDLKDSFKNVQIFVFCSAIPIIVVTYRTQKSFKLRASI